MSLPKLVTFRVTPNLGWCEVSLLRTAFSWACCYLSLLTRWALTCLETLQRLLGRAKQSLSCQWLPAAVSYSWNTGALVPGVACNTGCLLTGYSTGRLGCAQLTAYTICQVTICQMTQLCNVWSSVNRKTYVFNTTYIAAQTACSTTVAVLIRSTLHNTNMAHTAE